jgi:hypothetical protein
VTAAYYFVLDQCGLLSNQTRVASWRPRALVARRAGWRSRQITVVVAAWIKA